MKTNTNWKLLLPMLLILVSVAACKKSNNDTPTPSPVEVKSITITELRALSTGASVKVPDGRKVKGIVISDASAKNIDTKTVVLQEATDKPGIVVTFDAAQTFAVGDEIELTISNQTIAQVNGEITLQNIPTANAKKTGTGTITPRSTTIADINTNKAAWNGTLVSIADGLFNGSGKYAGTLTYASGNANIKSQVISSASFENTDYPTIVSGLTGIIRISGDDIFLNIRGTSDVKASASFVVVEDFSGATPSIYSFLRTIATNQLVYNLPLNTAFTTKYGTKLGEWIGSKGLPYNQTLGTSSTNIIKNIASGSSDVDASFLTPNKNYFCIMPYASTALFEQLIDPSSTRFGTEWSNFSGSISLYRGSGSDDLLKGIKSVTVVLAGSKMQLAEFDPTSAITTNVTYNANFDTQKDGFSVNLYTNKLEKIDASAVFHNQGLWQTVKFDNFNSKLSALDVDGGGRRNLFLTFASTANQRGTFSIGRAGATSVIAGSPIIIDKIIFEFSQKPDWAN